MTANIDFLQALASIQGQPSSTYPVQRNHPAPSPLQLQRTQTASFNRVRASTGNLASSALTISPPVQTPSLNMNQAPFGGPVSYTQWSAAAAPPLISLGYGHCLQQTQLPLQPMTTPTTRGYSTAPMLPHFPTPPPTPATNFSRFSFHPPPGYNMAMADTSSMKNFNRLTLPPPQLPPTHPVTAQSPSPTPSPSPSPSRTISHSQFETYLRETWPEDSLRRGSSIIRDSLYDKIVSVLQGDDTHRRLKNWIKRSEFFLVEKEGRGLLLAIPMNKSRANKKGVSAGGKSESRGLHKLVAKLEDFYYIISSYHNDKNGHHGIRKTYGMVSVE